MTALSERARRLRSRSFLIGLLTEVVIIAFAAIVYIVVREWTEGSPATAVENARRLLEFEQSIGIDFEYALVQLSLDQPWLRTFVNWIYIWGHWPIIISVGAYLLTHHRERYIWLRNAMFVSGMIGFAFFALVPMAPPRLSGLGYTDTISTWSSSYRVLQPPDYANLYAAMPSLHFGWDLLVGVALFSSTRLLPLRIFALTMPTLMAFAVIATANHWVLDVVVGLVVVAAGAGISAAIAHYQPAEGARDAHVSRRDVGGPSAAKERC
ncbi:MAG: phosphatase family protein [Thermoleophilia bacterium]|nr:phosphatase family protein [Thermoleophilia bacterium]